MVILKECFEKVDFEKSSDEKGEKFPRKELIVCLYPDSIVLHSIPMDPNVARTIKGLYCSHS